jgi:hypothetical protein
MKAFDHAMNLLTRVHVPIAPEGQNLDDAVRALIVRGICPPTENRAECLHIIRKTGSDLQREYCKDCLTIWARISEVEDALRMRSRESVCDELRRNA